MLVMGESAASSSARSSSSRSGGHSCPSAARARSVTATRSPPSTKSRSSSSVAVTSVVPATSALLANALKICPVLNVDHEGKLIPRQKIRTVKKAVAELVRMMEEHAEGGRSYAGKCCLSQSNCRAEAEAVVAGIEEKFPQLKGKIAIYNIGTVIGSHTGPGTVALFFMGDERVD